MIAEDIRVRRDWDVRASFRPRYDIQIITFSRFQHEMTDCSTARPEPLQFDCGLDPGFLAKCLGNIGKLARCVVCARHATQFDPAFPCSLAFLLSCFWIFLEGMSGQEIVARRPNWSHVSSDGRRCRTCCHRQQEKTLESYPNCSILPCDCHVTLA